MSNIFDYLEWRGDLSLRQAGFNCVDNLILTTVAYLFFDPVYQGEPITLRKAAKAFSQVPAEQKNMRVESDEKLLYAMAATRRFGDLQLLDYINTFDKEREEQFAAMCIGLGEEELFVAFRGTDNSLIGWKEDFNMGFLSAVPAQLSAVEYMNSVGKKFTGKFLLGGHSKGGNLACYGAAFCEEDIQKRVTAIYNNDGPGFQEHVTTQPGFQAIQSKIHTYVPQTSIIGMLLDHENEYTVIHSTQTGIFQHDPYTWEVRGQDFIRLEKVDAGSRMLDGTMKKWLGNMETEQRSIFVNTLFEMLMSTKAESIQQLPMSLLKNAGGLAKSYMKEDAKTKETVAEAMKLLLKSAKESVLTKGEEEEE